MIIHFKNEAMKVYYLSIMNNEMTRSRKIFKITAVMVFICSLGAMAADITERIPRVPADAKTPADLIFDQSLLQIVNATFRDNYDLAIRLTDSLLKKHPDHPAPYFF